MKKIVSKVTGVALATMIGFGFTACGEAPKPQSSGCNIAGEGTPMWVCMPNVEGGIAGIGSAQKSPGGFSFQKTEAVAQARDDLARQLSVKVKNMVKNFAQSTGVGNAQTFEKVSQQVSKQVANQTLSGSKLKNMWTAPNGTLYVMVVIDKDSVKQASKSAVKTSLKNDEALWQQFQAKKADQALDAEIDKM
jgi:ribosomal protein S20